MSSPVGLRWTLLHEGQHRNFGSYGPVNGSSSVRFGPVHLVAQEQSLELSLGPVVHGVGQQLHGDGVDSQEVAHKHDSLNVLDRERKHIIIIISIVNFASFPLTAVIPADRQQGGGMQRRASSGPPS